MPHTLNICLRVFVLMLPAAAQVCGQDFGDSNTMCPVLLDREAVDEYSVQYKGKAVRFCCSECIVEFQRHPEVYESVLPQFQDLSVRDHVQQIMGEHGLMVTGCLLGMTLVTLRLYNIRAARMDAASGWLHAVLQKRIPVALPLTVLCGYLGFELFSMNAQLSELKLEDELHFATFHDFGFPPTPRRPDVPARLSSSYYRGNDERSPRLFNNGNYRTGTFHVSLCDASGAELNHGDRVSGSLFVKLEIVRPPFTPDFLYDSEMMSTMFLTATAEKFLGRDSPVADAVELTETEVMQRWEALFPVPEGKSCCGKGPQRGTVYVCERLLAESKLPFGKPYQKGARFHYGIHYDLKIRDGILQDDSDVYMGALYRTRKLPTWRVPMSQWFSHEPIPELPSENVDDPELLGLGEHQAKRFEQ
ncbi:MAG: hypothetical protein R3C59_25970 [Planctomycetaceae bacterium]